jgi:hypothetical protein
MNRFGPTDTLLDTFTVLVAFWPEPLLWIVSDFIKRLRPDFAFGS